MTRSVCAILDDYQGIARTMADWTAVESRAELRVFRERFANEDALVAAVADCEVVVAMRERTRFPASVLARLPRLTEFPNLAEQLPVREGPGDDIRRYGAAFEALRAEPATASVFLATMGTVAA